MTGATLRLRVFRRSTALPLALAWIFIAAMLVLAAGADVFSPWTTTAVDLRSRLAPPIGFGGSWSHPLGTDNLGRDVLSRLLHAIQLSLLVAVVGSTIGAVVGTGLGLLAARMRGMVDEAIMILVDFQASMPFLIIALAALAFLGNSLTLFVCVLGLYGWERYARIARATSSSILERPFITASRQFGGGDVHVYLRHVLPNIMAPLIVNLTITIPEIVILESGLSFLGLGVQPPETSLGNMLGAGRDYLYQAWWLALFPGAVIALTSLAVSLVGDALRDRMDPNIAKSQTP